MCAYPGSYTYSVEWQGKNKLFSSFSLSMLTSHSWDFVLNVCILALPCIYMKSIIQPHQGQCTESTGRKCVRAPLEEAEPSQDDRFQEREKEVVEAGDSQ